MNTTSPAARTVTAAGDSTRPVPSQAGAAYPAAPSVIQIADLHMSYGSTRVLRGVDVEIRRGEVVALLGPNGAGKTTTIEILEGFRAPSSGHVRVLGEEPIGAGEEWRARVGVVLQSWRDHAKWRVRELLDHTGDFYRPYATLAAPRPWDTDSLLATVGLGGKHHRRIMSLSGGERRRLDVAMGIVGMPELLFLDEPTAGFDPEARRDFHDLVRGLADRDITVLLTTHDLDEAEKLADRVLILGGGRIVADGSPNQLRDHVGGSSDIRWTRDGMRHVHASGDPAGFLRDLLSSPGGPVTDLEVRRAGLEDAYMELVHRVEVAQTTDTTGLRLVEER